jgi:hypothetical protein
MHKHTEMITRVIKILIVLVILVVIPGARILSSGETDLSFSGIGGTLTMYYLYMTVAVMLLLAIKKIMEFLNREE